MILRYWTTLILSALCVRGLDMSARGPPTHRLTPFANPPARVFFIDDSEVAFYHDPTSATLYTSADAGETWSVSLTGASQIIEHPVDTRTIFALSRSTTHHMSTDRGQSWRTFSMPVPPALVARPLSFHSDPGKWGWILYQGTVCTRIGWGEVCKDETHYTTDGWASPPSLLLTDTSRCQFAHSSKDFRHAAPDALIYCVAGERLVSSTDWFVSSKTEDLGLPPQASKGVVAFAIVSQFAVVALRSLSAPGEMLLFVTVDTLAWAQAHFPHASAGVLRENAYTLVESTTHSLAVDVVLHAHAAVGTLFVSNSNGTFFVQSLQGTNRNEAGFVDYERVYGVEGIGIANVVDNADEVEAGGGVQKRLRTVITFDDGSSWDPIPALGCDASSSPCSLHLHSVTSPHNYGRVFSSPAPGFVMGVGSIGAYLQPYEACDTFLSTDGGLSWTRAQEGPWKYEFGDSGSVLLLVSDADGPTDARVVFSLDAGQTWLPYDLGADVAFRARAVLTVPDSTSQKFLVVGQRARAAGGEYVVVFLDFGQTRERQCGEGDFERWDARSGKGECLMGHRQFYTRRKATASCYVGNVFQDPVEHEENCACTDADYECDFNFIRINRGLPGQGEGECVPSGPEKIPAGVCTSTSGTYVGSSGWRKIPGNTCTGGVKAKEDGVERSCREAQPEPGTIIHQPFTFPAPIVQHAYFKGGSGTILVRLSTGRVFQSSNEGWSWREIVPSATGEVFTAFYHHPHSVDRAYLITSADGFYTTTDAGRSWNRWVAPGRGAVGWGVQVLRFHVNSDRIIFLGDVGCGTSECHLEAWYSSNNGRTWTAVERYVANCAWASDTKIEADPTEVICESWERKEGNQRFFSSGNANGPGGALQLVEGPNFYNEKRRKRLFEHVVGFAKFSEYLVVAEFLPDTRTLALQVSLDGVSFATGQFPPAMHPDSHAYTILESSTDSLFLHVTMESGLGREWGNILKSNSNGTYFGVSLEAVNRDGRGYVDFEKIVGLEGVGLANVVDVESLGHGAGKRVQTRITHNDGGTWKALTPPAGMCEDMGCALHLHGYTERRDPRAIFSSPSVVGLIVGVGNVGAYLGEYGDGDTFISLDGGFRWEMVRRGPCLWEVGDSGGLVVMVEDRVLTDRVVWSADEGVEWGEYVFGGGGVEKIRVNAIVTVPEDTSRRFVLFGETAAREHVAVHLDFGALTSEMCVLDTEDPGHDDFELWSPSSERTELCLFGRQTLYHRRKRGRRCVVGEQPKALAVVKRNCACEESDFECEFNYIRNSNSECVLVPNTTPLASDAAAQCAVSEDGYWYERTAYRRIPYSSCEGGIRPDRGERRVCPGAVGGRGGWFWVAVVGVSAGVAAAVGGWVYKWNRRGVIRLPERSGAVLGGGGWLDTAAALPNVALAVVLVGWEWVVERGERLWWRSGAAGMVGGGGRRGYRNVPVDEDARILRFEDEE